MKVLCFGFNFVVSGTLYVLQVSEVRFLVVLVISHRWTKLLFRTFGYDINLLLGIFCSHPLLLPLNILPTLIILPQLAIPLVLIPNKHLPRLVLFSNRIQLIPFFSGLVKVRNQIHYMVVVCRLKCYLFGIVCCSVVILVLLRCGHLYLFWHVMWLGLKAEVYTVVNWGGLHHLGSIMTFIHVYVWVLFWMAFCPL